MRILIAPDSFKDALSAQDVVAAITRGLRMRFPNVEIDPCPLSDGGEGATAVLSAQLGLLRVDIDTVDPLMRPLRTAYAMAGDYAVIELAAAAGLDLLAAQERDALRTTTLGVGRMIADAVSRGARRIDLAIGGSATNECGIGMAAAMGWRFLDAARKEVAPIGASLGSIAHIDIPALPGFQLTALCDVRAPLTGPEGAAYVYARQKGADDAAIAQLDAGAANLARVVARELRRDGLADIPGAGAAGGTGFGVLAFFNGALKPGADAVMDAVGFDARMRAADLVITGEGRLDAQTAQGKLVAAVARRAMSTPVIALCGRVDATREEIAVLGLHEAIEISDRTAALADQLARTAENLERAVSHLDL